MPNSSHPTTPFTQLITDFKGKKLPSEEIESDYNNTLNHPNNYFVAPKNWNGSFYTINRKTCFCLAEE